MLSAIVKRILLARKIHLHNAFEEAVYSLKSNVTKRTTSLASLTLMRFSTWLEYDSESASYEELQRKADQLYTKFGYRVDASAAWRLKALYFHLSGLAIDR